MSSPAAGPTSPLESSAGAEFLPEIKEVDAEPGRLSLHSREAPGGSRIMRTSSFVDVGAPDPELKNSPVVDVEIEVGE